MLLDKTKFTKLNVSCWVEFGYIIEKKTNVVGIAEEHNL